VQGLAAIQSGETYYEEQAHAASDGRTVLVALTTHRVVYGRQDMLLVVAQDITAQRSAEDALRTLNSDLERHVDERTAELRQANEALERNSHYKDEFLATMSHELRTPLTGILGSTEVLAGEKFGPLNLRQMRAMKLIQESGEHLLGLINSVLDLSKLEAGKLALDVETMPVRDVCLSALHMVQAQAKAKGQIVTFDCVPDNFWLQADARRLKQILINLLANAVKFTPENGSVRLEVGANFVEGQVTFCVDDNGIGIAPADLANIFTPFFQINRGLDRLYGGAGLGLALVNRLVQLHGGMIDVASAPGQGSRFTVTLPCHPKPLTPPQQQPTSPVKKRAPTLRTSAGRTPLVLLAEDHLDSIEVLSSLLEMAGCSLVIARRGDEVVAAAQSRQPDLILMDVQMPGMDGLAATRAIRNLSGAVSRTPIIALTAMALWGDRERCLEAGANEYISKPFNVDHLFETMRRQLGSVETPRNA
jgi:signal transduction histidine kinase/ActR/RegA family two-component response regulator